MSGIIWKTSDDTWLLYESLSGGIQLLLRLLLLLVVLLEWNVWLVECGMIRLSETEFKESLAPCFISEFFASEFLAEVPHELGEIGVDLIAEDTFLEFTQVQCVVAIEIDEFEDGLGIGGIEVHVVVFEHFNQFRDFNAIRLVRVESAEKFIDFVVLVQLFREEQVFQLRFRAVPRFQPLHRFIHMQIRSF